MSFLSRSASNSSIDSYFDLDSPVHHHQPKNEQESSNDNSSNNNNNTDSTSSSNSKSKSSKAAETRTLTFSFAAGGFLQIYMFGCAHAIITHLGESVRVRGIDTDTMPSDSDTEQEPQENANDKETSSETTTTTTQEEKEKQQKKRHRQQQVKKAARNIRFAGSSAGSLASAAILLHADMEKMLEYAIKCALYARSKWYRVFEIRRFVEEGVKEFATEVFNEKLPSSPKNKMKNSSASAFENRNSDNENENGENEMSSSPSASYAEPASPGIFASPPALPDEEEEGEQTGGGFWKDGEYFFPKHIRKQLTERLEIFATSVPWCQTVIFDDIRSTADLDEALCASCCLVPLAGLPFRLRRTGEFVVDGGLRNFQPRKNEPGVVTISSMYFNQTDVVPSVYVPAWWGLYPPGEREHRATFSLGYNDMVRYLIRLKIIEQPKTDSEEEKALFRPIDPTALPTRFSSLGNVVLDFFAAIFYIGWLRIIAMIFIYAELWFVSSLCFFATVFHEFFPRTFKFLLGTRSYSNRSKTGGRKEAAKDWWEVIRNLTSAKTWLHLSIGYRRNVNTRRLEKYSRFYRVFAPFLGFSSSENENTTTTTSAATTHHEEQKSK